MLKNILNSFGFAVRNIKAHFFHTCLSVLGIVIGVASLVVVLSLIDGLEDYVHNQISKTTSLESINISSETYEVVNGIRMKKQNPVFINEEKFNSLQKHMEGKAEVFILVSKNIRIVNNHDTLAVSLSGTGENLAPGINILKGRKFTNQEIEEGGNVLIINPTLAQLLDSTENVLNNRIVIDNKTFRIIGLAHNDAKTPMAASPISSWDEEDIKSYIPTITLKANTIEEVFPVKEDVLKWLKEEYPKDFASFSVTSNKSRVEQANKGFLLFRVVSGLLVGISVIVGGIGVMNVLIISVTERTAEIGVRKAVGAKKLDIMMQFFCESITISGFGSLLGLVVGGLGTLVVIPIIRVITDTPPFEPSYTFNTLLIISIISVLIGILFGTFPAIKAAALNPVDAIRKE